MSFLTPALTLLGIGPKRSFGTANQIFTGYVTVTESSVDKITITKQPVQQGAVITDHAFKEPNSLSIQIIEGSSLFGQSLSATYTKLLALQTSFIPFTVTTPKRVYNNMLLETLGVTTDKKTENILAINITFQNIITVPLVVGNVNRSQLANAGSNGGTQPVGQKQSFLSGIIGGASSLFSKSGVGG